MVSFHPANRKLNARYVCTLRSARHGTLETAVKWVEARSSNLCCSWPLWAARNLGPGCLGPPSLAPPCGYQSLGPHSCLPRWTARRQGRAPDTSDLSPLCLLPTSGLQRVRLQRVGVLPPRWNHSSILFPVKVFILRKRILFPPWASLHILKFP